MLFQPRCLTAYYGFDLHGTYAEASFGRAGGPWPPREKRKGEKKEKKKKEKKREKKRKRKKGTTNDVKLLHNL